MIFLPFRDCKIKRSHGAHLAFSPGLPAVAMDDALHDGQANPGALKFSGLVQALKKTKKLI